MCICLVLTLISVTAGTPAISIPSIRTPIHPHLDAISSFFSKCRIQLALASSSEPLGPVTFPLTLSTPHRTRPRTPVFPRKELDTKTCLVVVLVATEKPLVMDLITPHLYHQVGHKCGFYLYPQILVTLVSKKYPNMGRPVIKFRGQAW